MPCVALELGENSIDRAHITKDENGSLFMQWFVRLPNGRLVRRTTRESAARESCGAGRMQRRTSSSPRAARAVYGKAPLR